MTGELETAILEIERTIQTVRASECTRWVEELERFLATVREGDRYPQKEALFRIGELYHPKALGDASVTIGWEEWSAQLERLHDACARAFNQLEDVL